MAVIVVGSACLGRSLSPKKNLSHFHAKSDIDVAVISTYHFDEAWRWLRSLGPLDQLNPSSFERNMLSWHRRNLVFDGTIATDQLLGKLSFGPGWSAALGRAGNRRPTSNRIVKARIYRDFESVRAYQLKGVKEAAAAAASEEIDEGTQVLISGTDNGIDDDLEGISRL